MNRLLQMQQFSLFYYAGKDTAISHQWNHQGSSREKQYAKSMCGCFIA